jgi:hypothetical protein
VRQLICEMHIRNLDFRTVLKDRLRPLDQSYSTIRNPNMGAIVKPGRDGPTVPVQLRGGLQSPNKTITPTGTTIFYMTGGSPCIDNAPDTSLMAMSRTFRYRHREKATEGSVQSPHWAPLHRWSPRHGTVHTTRQYPILPYDI